MRPLNKLKMGDCFIFEIGGPVFIKCRGGFRLGTGGQLHACKPTQAVYPCNPANGQALSN